MSSIAQERREVRYRGQVQGVGFRYTAVRVARGYEVVGFVRNESDGSVHLVAEGASAELDAFLQDVAAVMSDYILDVRVQRLSATGEFSDFNIRR